MKLETDQHDVDIAGLTADSRLIRPGYLFAAIPGTRLDGRDFIADAVAAGAAAVLAPRNVTPDALAPGVSLLRTDNPRRALARMASAFYGRQPETVAAVTGTNGKTSVADFTRQIWTKLGHRSASLGTLGLSGPGIAERGNLTTPDPVELHGKLAELADQGVDHLAVEASSHGLEQFRLDGIRIAAAAFTNLTRDHLDYHGSMEDYRAAKLRLFQELLPEGGAAVLNAESPEFIALQKIAESHGLRVLSYGIAKGDLHCGHATAQAEGWDLEIDAMGETFALTFPLPGAFQVDNALAALGLAIACGAVPKDAAPLLAELEGVNGRLETVARLPSGARVLVDYAHTPDALENVLKAVRPHTSGRLIVVFGCGGDGDAGKRPEMGAIAARLADSAIVTDDNPRTEDPAAIRSEILAACPGCTEVGDRRDAIGVAISKLRAGDVLVVAGKGHETGQIVGDQILPFEDAAVVREYIKGGDA